MTQRRRFFRRLAGEACAAFEELQGKPQLRLADLPKLPDAALAKLVPAVREDVEIIVTDEDVQARLPRREEPVVLFAQDPVHRFVFNRFNGRTPISEVSAELAKELGEDDAFARVKELFLRLVQVGVCVPYNAGE